MKQALEVNAGDIMKDKQKDSPFVEAVRNYVKKGIIPFHTPGHIQGRGVSEEFRDFWQQALACDLAEVEHPESSHDYEVPRKEAEALLAELYGATRSFFLVNGTTEGIQALFLAFFKDKDTVLMPRNVHRSAIGGLILSGAKPNWVYPEIDRDWGIATSPNEEAWLKQATNISGAFHLYPNYYGLCPDLDHYLLKGVPNLIDEAHGPHFPFSKKLPQRALRPGVTATVQSPHKILSSLTQSSWLHVREEKDVHNIARALGLIESTSPNFLLWASLDAARAYEAAKANRWDELIDKVYKLRQDLTMIPGLEVYNPQDRKEIKQFDPLKLMVKATKIGLDGFELRDELRKRGIMPELAEPQFVLFIITPAHKDEELHALYEALEDIATLKRKSNIKRRELPVLPRLKAILTPKEAFFSPAKPVKLKEAIGYIAREMIIPYPPGIPLIMPGEEITKEVVELTQYYSSLGWPLRGLEDERAEHIYVIE